MRRVGVLALVALLAATSCGAPTPDPGPEPDGPALPRVAGAWEALPPSPLDARGGSRVTWTGTEVVVSGGETFVDETLPPCPGGASCAGPEPTYHPDAAAWEPATRTWRTTPPDTGLPAVPGTVRVIEPGRWVDGRFVAAGWSDETTKTVAVVVFDPSTGAWSIDEWPFPDPYQQELVSVWTGTELLVVARALGEGCEAGGTCRVVASWAPAAQWTSGTWRRVAEWPVDASTDGPGRGEQFSALVQAGGRTLGVGRVWDVEAGVEVVRLDPADGSTEPLPTLDQPAGDALQLDGAYAVGDDLVVGTGRVFAVLGADDVWRELPPVPGIVPSAARAVVSTGEELFVWGGTGSPMVPGTEDEDRGWTFAPPPPP